MLKLSNYFHHEIVAGSIEFVGLEEFRIELPRRQRLRFIRLLTSQIKKNGLCRFKPILQGLPMAEPVVVYLSWERLE